MPIRISLAGTVTDLAPIIGPVRRPWVTTTNKDGLPQRFVLIIPDDIESPVSGDEVLVIANGIRACQHIHGEQVCIVDVVKVINLKGAV